MPISTFSQLTAKTFNRHPIAMRALNKWLHSVDAVIRTTTGEGGSTVEFSFKPNSVYKASVYKANVVMVQSGWQIVIR